MALSAPGSPRTGDLCPTSCKQPSRSTNLQVPHDIKREDRAKSLPPRSVSPTVPSRQVRKPLDQYRTIDDAVELLKRSQRIVVLTGAGISTSIGIPDFRSASGLYKTLRRQRFDDPQELFHLHNFLLEPGLFYEDVEPIIPRLRINSQTNTNGKASAKEAMNLVPRYATTHAFLSLLESKNKLLTNYTQNIDGLELAAGVSSDKLINCHGSWETATCMTCGKTVQARKYLPLVYAHLLPLCNCIDRSKLAKLNSSEANARNSQPTNHRDMRVRLARKEKNKSDFISSDEDDTNTNKKSSPHRQRQKMRNIKEPDRAKKRKAAEYEDTSDEDDASLPKFIPGLLKPDITFFGEAIPGSYMPRLETDVMQADLLLITGTSLQVGPVNNIPFVVSPDVPQIWISKERCQRSGLRVDIELIGDCDIIINELCRRAGWPNALVNRLWRPNMRYEDHQKLREKKEKASKSHTSETPSVSRESSPLKQFHKQPLTMNARHAGATSSAESETCQKTVPSSSLKPLNGDNNAIATTTVGLTGSEMQILSATNNVLPHETNQVSMPLVEVPPAVNPAPTPSVKNHESEISSMQQKPPVQVSSRCTTPIPNTPSSAVREKLNTNPKVVVELEEGTDNRWFIRPKKS